MAAAARSQKAEEEDTPAVEDDMLEESMSSEEREIAKDLFSCQSEVPLAERSHLLADRHHIECAPFRPSRDASYTRCYLQSSDRAVVDPANEMLGFDWRTLSSEEGLRLGYYSGAAIQHVSALQRAPTIEPPNIWWPPDMGMDMGDVYRDSSCSQASAKERLMDSQRVCGTTVVLRVYDLADLTRFSGLPIFHLGVEIYRREYYYSSKGISYCNPCRKYGQQRGKGRSGGICYCWCHALFREGIPLGRTTLSRREVLKVIHDLCREEWRPEAYHPLGQNCQTFAVKFCERLGLPEGCIPAKYCRFSELEDLQSSVTNAASSLMEECDVFCRSCAVEKKQPAYEISMQPVYDEHMPPLSVKAIYGGA